MSITVIKCISRYGFDLFNSCCGIKITGFFAYLLGLNNLAYASYPHIIANRNKW